MQLRFSLAASLLAALPGAAGAAADAPDERRGRRLGRRPYSPGASGPIGRAGPAPAVSAPVTKDVGGVDSQGFATYLVALTRARKVVSPVAGQAFGVASPTDVAAKCYAAADAAGGEVQEVFTAMGGCALRIPESRLFALSSLQMVDSAERDQVVTIPETNMQQNVDAKELSAKMAKKDAKKAAEKKSNEKLAKGGMGRYSSQGGDDDVSAQAVLWGLDRVDQCSPVPDGASTRLDAEGVRVYVIDTGVYGDHVAFGDNLGPLDCHHTSPGSGTHDSTVNPIDGNGHGTHVAGTACSAAYGVADCEVCSVRVLGDTGSGSEETVLSGLEFILEQCAANDAHPARRCVANMSLGSASAPTPGSLRYKAVQDLEDAGVVVVVAAGNSNADACHYNPAGHPDVLTVGSTTEGNGPASYDQASDFSSYGQCTDVYAPGAYILSAWPPPFATNTISGTSMASPHVAGLAAHAMSIKDDWAPTKESAVAIKNGLFVNAYNTLVSKADDDTNSNIRIANSEGGCNAPSAPPTPSPPTPPPCPLGWVAELTLTTDNYPAEISWTLKDLCNDLSPTIWSGSGYSLGTHVEEECLAPGKYEFTMNDSYGDGFCCDYGTGSYVLMVATEQVVEGGNFGSTEATEFGECDATAPPVDPDPTTPPIDQPTPVVPAPTTPPVNAPAPTTPPNSVPAPTTPPVDPPTPVVPAPTPPVDPDAPPAIVIGQASVFTFHPRAACFAGDAGTAAPAGTSAGQCAQACAVLLDCDGFEAFPDAAGVHEEGSCVLARSGDEHGPPGGNCAHPVWFYERVMDA